VTSSSKPAFDCFYVYPTVSTQSTDNSNLKVQAAEIDVAVSQASPFSQVCRVYAPMYRQRTIDSILTQSPGNAKANKTAYDSILSGWEAYLDHYNDKRPFVLIGHSQGAAMVILLIEHEIDGNAALRHRLISAIILGGNVAVPTGKVVGSTFKHVGLCTRPSETGCAIAYSSFPSQPPSGSFFGVPGQGVSLQSGQKATKGVQVACVNPAAIGGGTGSLEPWFLTATQPAFTPAVTTPWVTYPELYTSTCETAGDATWLQVTDVAAAGDDRPVVKETLGALWGFHLYDVNLATQNLVSDVHGQEAAYTSAHH
jgi:pimeloyl-ACP methyl ester carboxylesterase